jgi:murein DD-endopeptidase MepM/ murein hydrolase activator NlpD
MTIMRFSLGLIFLCALIIGNPSATSAASRQDAASYGSFGELVRHFERRSSSRDRDRYSSAITREIRKLDDDAVEDLKIPVLLGVSVSQLSPNFGDARGGGTRTHEGLDIMAPLGAFVASPTDAVVVRTGEGESAGIYVYTANPGGETFAYMHLDSIADGVKAGTVLEEGDLIGYVGNTGNAAGGAPHLHFEIRDSRGLVDPYPRITETFTLEERIAVLKEILAELQKELARRK